MTLRQIVNKIAKEKKRSVASVARSLGMTSQAFNSYLRGNPRMDNLMKIANALDVDPKMLMIRNDYKPEANEVNEPSEPWQLPEQPNQTDNMTELQHLQEKYDLLKEVAEGRRQKILNLESELNKCQESNRVHTHT